MRKRGRVEGNDLRGLPGSSAVVLVMVAALLACQGAPIAKAPQEPANAPATPVAPVKRPETPMSETTALFTAPDGRKSTFRVEVADTPDLRERGLMFRRSMDPERGMVFVFPTDDVLRFWMKNTFIPLDMVFVESTGRVAGVVEDARPFTMDTRTVGVPSRYVVELNSRTARAKGIGPGATVVFEPALKPASR